MAETPTRNSTDETPSDYWCYNCNKRVSVETLGANENDVVCYECKDGFVESIPWTPPFTNPTTPDHYHAPSLDESSSSSSSSLGSQFFQMLRIFAQGPREDDAPSTPFNPDPPVAPEPQSDDDFLRIELDGWEDDENDAEEEEEGVVLGGGGGGDVDDDMDEERRRRRRELILSRMRDIATRARRGRNRILDWAEILMGLEDNFELRFELSEPDRYVGNQEDYVDAAGFEALLQNLAESDSGGKRGAPPAAKAAVEGLKVVRVRKEEEGVVCAICKDGVCVGEEKTELPCSHGYHGECIVTWLGSRNSCPVCRFELPTDDVDYEEERRKKVEVAGGSRSS